MTILRKKTFIFKSILIISLFINIETSLSQPVNSFVFADTSGILVKKISLSDSVQIDLVKSFPAFTFHLNGRKFSSSDVMAIMEDEIYTQTYNSELHVTFSSPGSSLSERTGMLVFENRGNDTLVLSNILPFGNDDSSVYITSGGQPDLARAWLHRPGYRPLRVILPDNAWDLGYSSVKASGDYSVCALIRRRKVEGGERKRYETILPPEAKAHFSVNAGVFKGEWQAGLRMMFRDHYLYDLESFDNSLYQREDLAWIRNSYLIILQMAWDREFYDRFSGKFTYPDALKKGIEQFGKIDIYGIWPTWPRLGLDQRTQWDLYRDLPGGTGQLKSFIKMSRQSGTRVFIAYNPWDSGNYAGNQIKGMAQLIAETEADGVVLDTRGSSSIELQNAADTVRKGVVMYSEGMAIPADMPGIIAGRVHNAIYLSPELNLNKLIKPDFSIFRVCDVGEAPIHREAAISFFNGYGTELNMFRPGGRNDRYREDLDFLSLTTFILRQNNDAFLDSNWTPLIETTIDNVFVNRWNSGNKKIYSVLNMRPDGIDTILFKIDNTAGKHYVSIWNHENLEPVFVNNAYYVPSRASGWPAALKGTRNEGSVDCIAEFPDIIKSSLRGDSLHFVKPGAGKIVFWKGNPSYKTTHKEFRNINDTTINVRDLFGYYEGKIVVQYIEQDILKDENILTLAGGKPWLISKVINTPKATAIPPDMVLVPGTEFSFNVSSNEDLIIYPDINGQVHKIDSFLIDKYPVTNAQFYEFMLKSNYWPADTARFLRHWQSGTFRQGQDKYPVVNVSYEDMVAYARWAEKRLPTEAEWQLAAQGLDKRIWPWGNEFHGTFCNNSFNRPTPVDAFSRGLSPYGALDMVGNVWQMTNDTYFNGSNYFTVIRGGSYYKPEASTWYLQGGPQPLDKTQILLLVSPGFDRSPTVGFRCVRDIDRRSLKQ